MRHAGNDNRLWRSLAGAALGLCAALPAAAQDPYENEPLPGWYLGTLGGYMSPDAARDADGSLNGQIVLGAMLAEALALELNAFSTRLRLESNSSREDFLYGGGLDLTLGYPAPGNPIFMIGGGAIEQKISNLKSTSGYGNLGLGLYLPFSFGGELWRLEARYNVVFNDHPALPNEELLEDGRINLGVMFTFGHDAPPQPEPEPEPAPPPAPSMADADGDGVADEQDKCPDTPGWVRPDADGCIPDSDGDGIDDAKDCCAGTPAGTAVDESGCEPPPPPPLPQALAAPLPPADADKDGVPDTADACPHTVPLYNVDAKGCLIVEEVAIKNVHFDVGSSRLTAEGYAVLRSVAAALKADPGTKVEAGGHADITGSQALNDALARDRANVVRDFLIYAGVPSTQVTAKGYGARQPIADNRTAEGRAANRRVQFKRLNGG
jgi:outer membrane protein OmpA-like peptidoglycan-associated protein